MNAESWRRLLESIRPEDQTQMIVRTADAMEVAVESFARIEEDVLLLKGRLSGAPDGRRLFVIPYDKLASLYVNRVVANDEIPLFSPTVPREEKDRIAQMVAERVRAAQQAAKDADPTRSSSSAMKDVKSQLEELKRTAQLPATNLPGSPPLPRSAPAAVPAPGSTPAVGPGETSAPIAIPGPVERKPGGRVSLPDAPKFGGRN